MNTIQGAIESVSMKTTATGQSKYGIKVLGKWYNGWGGTTYKKDDLVRIEYTTTGYGNQIKFIGSPSPILPAPSFTPKVQMEADTGKANCLNHSKERTITRLACVRSACVLLAGKEPPMQLVVAWAREFEKYVEEG